MDFSRSAAGLLVPTGIIAVGGVFHVEHMRGGELIDATDDSNLVVNEGLNHLLDVVFHAGTPVGTWFLGLFEGNYTPIATLTAATLPAASTESVAYTESTRQEYNEGAASGQSTTNAANKATFTINATKNIYGAFLVSNSTKGGTSGVLFSAARFAAPKSVAVDDQLLLTYTFNASSI